MNSTPQRKVDLKQLVTMAMLVAIAFLVMYIGRVPVVLFLKYDPKDVVITIGGFIYGPVSAFVISLVVSVIEMLVASDTAIIGLIMNVLASCAFACTASYIYRKKRTLGSATAGLITAWIFTTAVMMFWNYLITPIYMNRPREEVIGLLIPAILPFNLLKGGLNATVTTLLYRPVITQLRRAGLIPRDDSAAPTGRRLTVGVTLAALAVFATCVMFILVLQGII